MQNFNLRPVGCQKAIYQTNQLFVCVFFVCVFVVCLFSSPACLLVCLLCLLGFRLVPTHSSPLAHHATRMCHPPRHTTAPRIFKHGPRVVSMLLSPLLWCAWAILHLA
jgi:hypothetical protein